MKVVVIEDVAPDELSVVLEELQKRGAKPGEIAAVKRELGTRDVDWRRKIGEGVRRAALRRKSAGIPQEESLRDKRARAGRLGGIAKASVRHRKAWSRSEVRVLKEFYADPVNHFSNGKMIHSRLRIFARSLGRNPVTVGWKASVLGLSAKRKRMKVAGTLHQSKGGAFHRHPEAVEAVPAVPDVRVRRAKFMHSRARFYVSQYQYPYPKALAAAAQEWNLRGKKRHIPTWPDLESVKDQEQVQSSFHGLFQQAEKGPVSVTMLGAFTLFGIGDFNQWTRFLTEVITKAASIESFFKSVHHIRVQAGRDSCLLIS